MLSVAHNNCFKTADGPLLSTAPMTPYKVSPRNRNENGSLKKPKVPKDVASKFSVEYTGFRAVDDIIAEKSADREDAFFVVDLGKVIYKYKRWVEELPTVKPFFAIKCNPNTAIIRTLAAMGTGFDCASRSEMQQVRPVCARPARLTLCRSWDAASPPTTSSSPTPPRCALTSSSQSLPASSS